jgi:hypothetical protein
MPTSYSVTVNAQQPISGVLTYDNYLNTQLGNVTVDLYSAPNSSGYIRTVTTDASGTIGHYSLSGCPNTNYYLLLSTTKTTSGINSTDAAQVNYWGVAPYSIETIKFLAGDASDDNLLNGFDASKILAYFVNDGLNGTAFYTPWQFWKQPDPVVSPYQNPPNDATKPYIPISVGIGPVTQNLYGLCTGDFNGSFIPGSSKEASNTLSLTYGATLQVKTGDEFDLPLSTQSAIEVGAVSLILDFPSDQLQILGVTLADKANTPLMYNVKGDELRIGWYSRDELSLKAGDKLLTLRVKLISSLNQNEIIHFTLAGDRLNELADDMAKIIPDAVLNIDVVGTTLGINPGSTSETLIFTNYPNPFTGTTTLAYSLPVDGKVTIELHNTIGVLERVVMDNIPQTAGDYKLVLDASNLSDGIYIANLKLITSDAQIMTRTIKIVRTY